MTESKTIGVRADFSVMQSSEIAVQSSQSNVKQRSSVYGGTGMPSLFSRFNGSLFESFDRSPLDRSAGNERGAKTHAFSDK